MPVIWCADDDGIDTGIINDVTEISEDFWSIACDTLNGSNSGGVVTRIDISECHHVDICLASKDTH